MSPKLQAVVTGGGRTALVLGGGGITGIGWEIGVIAGLADSGIDLRQADLVIGTSAGSFVGALVLSDLDLREIYEAQLVPDDEPIGGKLGLIVALRYVFALGRPGDAQRARARLGRLALRVGAGTEAERLRIIEERLPVREWPTTRFLITAVDAQTGEAVTFDRGRGVRLVEAVAASCAVPLVWPPATIEGRRYMDGGTRSVVNADLAQGCDRVVVIAPITAAVKRRSRVAAQLARLGPDVRSVVISPGREGRRALGRNVLDPSRRAAAARAGWAQAAAVADSVRAVWPSAAAAALP